MNPTQHHHLQSQPALLLLIASLFAAITLSEAGDTPSLSIADAIARSMEKHPALAVFDADVRAAESRILTALARPNPELEYEIEDVLGTGIYEDFDSAIHTLGIVQLLELGNKRQMRETVARGGVEIEELRYQVARREVVAQTARLFVAVLAAQSAEDNAQQVVGIAQETVDVVAGLEEGGRGAAVDVKRSELGRKQAQLELENKRRETALARQRLAAMWGEAKPSFERASGRLTSPSSQAPSTDRLRASLENHPAVAMAKAGVNTAEHALALEHREVAPDIEVGVGWRRDSTVDDNAVVFRVSLPLPLWNRNEGGIAEAEAAVLKNEVLVAQTLTQLDLAMSDARTRLVAAQAEHQLITTEMLPAAEEVHRSLTEGFSLGRTTYLELLEARRSLTATRSEQIEALAKYHAARVELEALSGALAD